MRRLRVAVVGYGRLGRACAGALRGVADLELAGVVLHRAPAGRCDLPHGAPAAAHLRELRQVEAALVCVPAAQVPEVAREVLQQRIPVVECAALEGEAREAHYRALGIAARHHHVAAVVGAGWDPGALPLVSRLFEVLIPHGRTESVRHPGMRLHHTASGPIPGAKALLSCERRATDGRPQRYVYVELDRGASLTDVEQAIASDPLYADTETLVFPVADAAALEAASSGIVLTRCAPGGAGAHASLILEARFDAVDFAAHIMLDAVRKLPWLEPGAHRYGLDLHPARAVA